MKYHVNAKGEAAECTASVKPCPLGGEHFETLEDAQFAAELSQLLGEKIEPKAPTDQEDLLDPAVEARKVLRLLEGTAQTHQFIRALTTEGGIRDEPVVEGATPRISADLRLGFQNLEMLKAVTELYFARNARLLDALPPADVFSAGELLEAGSIAEVYSMTRGTLDAGTTHLNRVRLLAGGNVRNWADSDFLRREGELTDEMALARIGELTRQFDADMGSRLGFLQVTNPVDEPKL